MKYRSSAEIVDSILHSIETSGATRTRIMYKAMLSYAQLNEYLALMQRAELIEYHAESKLYTMAPKGLVFLNKFSEIKELISIPARF